MIQRIQSVYYLIAIALLLVMGFVPLVEYQVLPEADAFNAFSLESTGEQILAVAIALNILLLVVVLLRFKTRFLQVKLSQLSLTFLLLLYGVFALFHYQMMQMHFEGVANAQLEYQLGLTIPALCTIFVWLGMKAVKKDEALVRSADRLR